MLYSLFPTLRILENKSGELAVFTEIDTRMHFENTFRDIAKSANTTAHNAKLTIELHGQVLKLINLYADGIIFLTSNLNSRESTLELSFI